ncbi:hypothetical protein PW52_00760 [Tamlana sedimentorum]|uniref:Glycosyltransferase n=1 Tax=Neotamlana sedimentorum TaxID=1435349 RepID=A0A0D7WE93_9FLAO|nr:TIGR04282 family arsenosugar biosynthesis glycosyltransferase [Tamlana sedimentorum]KJD37023.1 hypothetical protein PW52_00760 [Tamlana sedimentorum]
MTNTLLIVFVKNKTLGTVKTRLAKTIGDYGAFEVYTELLKITEKVANQVPYSKRIYFSNNVEENTWGNHIKTIQNGANLGDRMLNAFKDGFNAGYENIVLIGSDLPDISETEINEAFEALKTKDAVFGPAEDGGYYLIGLSKLIPEVFSNKPWSQPSLLNETLKTLTQNNSTFSTLKTLNDIDTYDDLIASKFYKNNKILQEKIQQLND